MEQAPTPPKPKFNFVFLLVAIWAVFIIKGALDTGAQATAISYDEFLNRLDQGQIADVVVTDKQIRGTLKDPAGDKPFVTTRMEPELATLFGKKNVKFSRAFDNTFLGDLFLWITPTLLIIGAWIFMARRLSQGGMPGGFMSLGKNKARIYMEKDIETTFKDVAGADEAKEELQEVVGFLKSPKDYGRLGARTPKGVLLVGPPGTGKTLLAKAIAGEAGVAFFSISGSEFVEMFVGLGAARVRDLFEQARAKAPCIIFIDELDALGKSRNTPFAGGHDEKEQTLNQLLSEMDGFDSSVGIVILAATNRPEILDPALLRSGRFDRQIVVDRPDRKGRLEILGIHVRKIRMARDLNLEQVAELTPGFTGADLANLVNEAAIVATRRGGDEVTLSDFTQAFERQVAGIEKRDRVMDPEERRIVAFHEMGHALVGSALPGCDPVHKVSIVARGHGALGYTLQRPVGDRYLLKEEDLKNRLAALLGGRAAERVVFGHLSTGAADDLAKATDLARHMVTRYGMDRTLGSVAYETETAKFLAGENPLLTQRNASEETLREVDLAVKKLTDEALRRAERILSGNRSLLDESATLLLEKETLEQEDLQSVLRSVRGEEGPTRVPDFQRGISPLPG